MLDVRRAKFEGVNFHSPVFNDLRVLPLSADSVTCPEALVWLTAIVFYKMRSRVYPASAGGQVAPFRNALPAHSIYTKGRPYLPFVQTE